MEMVENTKKKSKFIDVAFKKGHLFSEFIHLELDIWVNVER